MKEWDMDDHCHGMIMLTYIHTYIHEGCMIVEHPVFDARILLFSCLF